MKALYLILLVIAAITVAVLFFFFLWGLSDGTVGASNGGLWLAMLAIPSGALAGGVLAWQSGNRALALILLLLPGVPALIFTLFFGAIVILAPDWR